MLRIVNLRKTYANAGGPVVAVDDVSMTVSAGEFVAVQGASGCGKTTLLLAAGGLLQPDGGQVSLGESDPYAMTSEQRARFRARKVGFVFQRFHLVPYLDVLDNVLSASLAIANGDADARARELIEHFGMSHRLGHVPGELSTGERQRVALARALLNRPELLLADEPTGNLDSESSKVVLSYFREFADLGGAVLLVTHDANAAACADRTGFMTDGRLQAG